MKFTPYAVGCGAQLNPNFSSARCTSVTPCNTCILKAEINGLREREEIFRAKTSCSIGVGHGDGNLVVHGSYDAVKVVQRLILACERAACVENDVTAVLRLLEAGEWAEHCTSSPLGKRLESAITALHAALFPLRA